MAVYTNDLRLKEIATGDESGTWGASTNTNLELIAEAFSFGTEAITTNADTHTTTISDGTSDPGRSIFLKYTGTLDSACTITIGPNTVSKLWFIENATSGSQNIIIKQGSGATVTIANGQTKAIYSDGAGSGGAMVDAFTDLAIPSLFVEGATTITTADNLTQLTLKSTDTDANVGPRMDLTRDSSSPAASDSLGQIRFMGEDAGDNSISYAHMTSFIVDPTDGSEDGKFEIDVRKAGTQRSRLLLDENETVFNNEQQDIDFRVESDGNANMLFVDAGNDHVNIGTSTDLGGVFNVFGTGAGNARVVIEGESSADPYVNFLANNTTHFSIGIDDSDSDSFKISHNSALGTNDRFKIDTNGQTHLIGQDEESSGDGYNYNLILAPDTSLSIAAGKGTGILFQSEDSGSSARHAANINSFRTASSASNTSNGLRFSVRPNGTDMIETFRLRSDEAVFNENSGNIDFRVESDSDFTAFFVDAGNSRVGINEDAPENALHINGGSGNIPLTIESTDTECALELRDSTGSSFIKGRADLRFEVNSADVVRMESGVTVVNEAGADYDFRVESQHLTHLLFCDGGNSKVGIGLSSPDNRLHVVDSTTGAVAPVVIGNEDNTAVDTQKVRLGFGLSRDSGAVKNDAGEIEVGKDAQWSASDANIDSYMAFATYRNNFRTEQFRVNANGMFLINATSNINSGGGTKPGLCVRGAGGGPHVVTLRNLDTSGGANQIEFQDGDGDVCGAINSNATSNTTSYGTSSDYRLKENVSAVSGAIEKLKLLEPKTYNFISDSAKTKEDGFLAHELAEVIPNAVTGEKDAVHENGEMNIQQVDYGKLTPLLTAALQEAIAKIETLETEIAALKGG